MYTQLQRLNSNTGSQVIPGSHKHNLLNADGSSMLFNPADGAPTTADAISVQVQAGDAVFFDRRVWCALARNSVARNSLHTGRDRP
eukprot:COSAG02_NODE_100_length_36897_cov_9.681749_44_plen_86_part_00